MPCNIEGEKSLFSSNFLTNHGLCQASFCFTLGKVAALLKIHVMPSISCINFILGSGEKAVFLAHLHELECNEVNFDVSCAYFLNKITQLNRNYIKYRYA